MVASVSCAHCPLNGKLSCWQQQATSKVSRRGGKGGGLGWGGGEVWGWQKVGVAARGWCALAGDTQLSKAVSGAAEDTSLYLPILALGVRG
jgi:hypothetical protein